MLDPRRTILLFLALFFAGVANTSTCSMAADEGKNVRDVGQIKLKSLDEISGAAASRQNPDTLWVHNDGSSSLVFAVNTSGKLAAMVGFPVEIEDVEDIAIGPGPKAGADYIYVGDIGDNDEERDEIRVVRFPEPKVSEARGGQIEVEAAEEFRLTYPDGQHNAETLIVDPLNGDLYVVTKEQRNARLFTCPASQLKDKAAAKLKFVGTLSIYKVSGGAIARDGSQIIVRREDQGWLWNRGRDQSVADALKARPQRIPVRGDEQGSNGEAVSFNPDGKSYYTVSEGRDAVICEFRLPPADSKARP